MKIILGIIFVAIIIWGLVNFLGSDEWLPIYYPNPSNLNIYINGPVVDSLEQCRDWIDAEAIRRNQSLGEYDYECGKNCNLSEDKFYICEKTSE